MSKTGRIFLSIGFVFCIFSSAFAADVTFNASVNKTTVTLDDTVQYTLEVSGSSTGNTSSPDLPEFTNLSVAGQSQSSSFSFINGQVSVSRSFIYTLQPVKEGPAHIGPASIIVGGKTYTTEPIDVTVTKEEGRKTQPGSQPGRRSRMPGIWDDFDDFFNAPFGRSRRQQTVEEPIKVELRASQTTAYVNQQILLTFTFYRRINFSQSPSYSPPNTAGFWAVNLPTEKSERDITLNGIKYMAQDFKTVLFPTTAGDFTIGPATITAQTDPFASPQTIKTDPLKVKVLPLPQERKPDHFSGAVGDYRMDVQLKQSEVERGQPVQITVKISGKGNIQTISEPVSALPGEFKKLSASGKEDLVKGKNEVSGSKSFEIVLIPLKEGRFTLPPFEFSYFDPLKKEYRTLKSDALHLNILPSTIPLPKEYEEGLADETTKKQVAIIVPWKEIGDRILKIATSIFFWLPVLTISMVVILFVLYGKYRERLVKDPAKLRQRQALRVARRRLKKSLHLLKQNELKEFLGEIFNATAKYLGDKYGFSAAGITTDGLRDILSRKGLALEAQRQVENFISECDMLRFTPSSLSREKAVELSQVAEKLIVSVEKGA